MRNNIFIWHAFTVLDDTLVFKKDTEKYSKEERKENM